MTGDGTVKSTSGDKAVVIISKSSACGHNCASCKACSNPSYEMNVLNPIHALVGDKVVIESDSSKILVLSLILYIVPVFLMISAAVICQEYSLGIFSLLVFVVLGFLWFCIIRFTNKKIKIKNTITKIIESSPKEDQVL